MKLKQSALLAVLALFAFAGLAVAQVAQPVITRSPPPPNYGSVEINIQCDTPGAVIHYTLDGHVPTDQSAVFDPENPIVLYEGVTIVMALATLTGEPDSPVAIKNVTVDPERVLAPYFDPPSRPFYGKLRVWIGCDTDGATIYYTLDGNDPTRDSPIFDPSHTILLKAETTIKAMAVKEGMSDSEIGTQVYTVLSVTQLDNGVPVTGLSGDEGSFKYFRFYVPVYARNLQLSISGGSGDCDMLVKAGSPPTETDYDYYPQQEGNDETVFVDPPQEGWWYVLLIGFSGGYQDVQLKAEYTGSLPQVAAPVITPGGGQRIGKVLMSMGCETDGAVIRYTLDGSEPTTGSALYTGPFKIAVTPKIVVKAKAFLTDYEPSETTLEKYKMARWFRLGTSRPINGPNGVWKYFAVIIPDEATRLVVSLSGGNGDIDVWVGRTFFPTQKLYDGRSINPDNNDRVTIDFPRGGSIYYIMLRGSGNGATLSAFTE